MTTIVLNKNVMAADSQVTSSHITTGFQKIHETDIGIYGFAGDAYDLEILIKAMDALYTDSQLVMDEDEEVYLVKPEIIMVDTSHTEDTYSQCVYFIKETGETGLAKLDAKGCVRRISMQQPIALGSGQDFAITAIQLGKSAKEAVKAAIALDPYSGGEIQTVKCKIKS